MAALSLLPPACRAAAAAGATRTPTSRPLHTESLHTPAIAHSSWAMLECCCCRASPLADLGEPLLVSIVVATAPSTRADVRYMRQEQQARERARQAGILLHQLEAEARCKARTVNHLAAAAPFISAPFNPAEYSLLGTCCMQAAATVG